MKLTEQEMCIIHDALTNHAFLTIANYIEVTQKDEVIFNKILLCKANEINALRLKFDKALQDYDTQRKEVKKH